MKSQGEAIEAIVRLVHAHGVNAIQRIVKHIWAIFCKWCGERRVATRSQRMPFCCRCQSCLWPEDWLRHEWTSWQGDCLL